MMLETRDKLNWLESRGYRAVSLARFERLHSRRDHGGIPPGIHARVIAAVKSVDPARVSSRHFVLFDPADDEDGFCLVTGSWRDLAEEAYQHVKDMEGQDDGTPPAAAEPATAPTSRVTKTVVQMTVLHPSDESLEGATWEKILAEIDDGGWLGGGITLASIQPVPDNRLGEECEAIGSDESFFGDLAPEPGN